MKKITLLILIFLTLLPLNAQAAQGAPWYALLLAVVTISTLVSSVLVLKNKKYKTITEKAMLFGAWFWFLIFIQVMLYGIYIGLSRYFS